jgi:hypothetical protein
MKFVPLDRVCDMFSWRWLLLSVLRWKRQSACSWNSGVTGIIIEVDVDWLPVCPTSQGAILSYVYISVQNGKVVFCLCGELAVLVHAV